MIKSSLKIETFLEYLLPGVIFVGGLFYLYGPLISSYFPLLSLDNVPVGERASILAIKFTVLIIISLAVGLVFKHLADITIVAVVQDDAESEKSSRYTRKLLRTIFKVYTFNLISDPRVSAITRYLKSERKEVFLRMVDSWAQSTEVKLESNSEKIHVHQHIIAHLKVLSDNSRAIVNELFDNVNYTGTLFLSVSLLWPLSLIAVIVKHHFQAHMLVRYYILLSIINFVIYISAVVSAYVVKRRFRHLCSQTLTIGIQTFIIEESGNKNA